jgi:hypothetical protein
MREPREPARMAGFFVFKARLMNTIYLFDSKKKQSKKPTTRSG